MNAYCQAFEVSTGDTIEALSVLWHVEHMERVCGGRLALKLVRDGSAITVRKSWRAPILRVERRSPPPELGACEWNSHGKTTRTEIRRWNHPIHP